MNLQELILKRLDAVALYSDEPNDPTEPLQVFDEVYGVFAKVIPVQDGCELRMRRFPNLPWGECTKVPSAEDAVGRAMEFLTQAITWDAFQSTLTRYTVGIIAVEGRQLSSRTRREYAGSGTLVTYRGRHLVATCAHTFQRVRSGSFCARIIRKGLKGYRAGTVVRKDSIRLAPVPIGGYHRTRVEDLALMFVEPAEYLANDHLFYPLDQPPVLSGNGTMFAFGNPGRFHVTARVGRLPYLRLNCVALSGGLNLDEWSDGQPNRPVCRVRIQPTSYLIASRIRRPPNCYKGMSGGGVWCQRPDGSPVLAGIALSQLPACRPSHFEGAYLAHWLQFAAEQLDREP